MARSSRKQGFRPITVDGAQYRWRCDDNRTADLEIHLETESSARSRLCVNFECPTLPLPITGRIVSAVIREAITVGWNPQNVVGDYSVDLVEVDEKATAIRLSVG